MVFVHCQKKHAKCRMVLNFGFLCHQFSLAALYCCRDEDVGVVRPIRNQLCDLMNIARPVLKVGTTVDVKLLYE